jgi:hypothetical protein
MNDYKPPIVINGDENAFAILGRCLAEGRRAAWDEKYLKEFLDEATSSDYTYLLKTVSEYFTVLEPQVTYRERKF